MRQIIAQSLFLKTQPLSGEGREVNAQDVTYYWSFCGFFP